MKKGIRKKLELQQALRQLAREKGYANVTMKDIGEYVGLSVGGLYHHYHSVREIFEDLMKTETDVVWNVFRNVDDFAGLMDSLSDYLKSEKEELLLKDKSLNALWYQFYFSLPDDERIMTMKVAQKEADRRMQSLLLPVFKDKPLVKRISEHISTILHGLVILSISDCISSKSIDNEFAQIINYLKDNYQEVVK
ncbi:MAG: TetR/AcrR family transcriptional regulator [Lachnospiraceae bacterium]